MVFCRWALSVSPGGWFLFVLIWSSRNIRLSSHATSCSIRWKLPSIIDVWVFVGYILQLETRVIIKISTHPWYFGVQAKCDHTPAKYGFFRAQSSSINTTDNALVLSWSLQDALSTTNYTYPISQYLVVANSLRVFNRMNRCILWAPLHIPVYFFSWGTDLRSGVLGQASIPKKLWQVFIGIRHFFFF